MTSPAAEPMKANRRSTFDYSEMDTMTAEMKGVFAMLDEKKDGKVTTENLMNAAKAHQKQLGKNEQCSKIVMVLLASLLMFVVGIFGLTCWVFDLSKETKVNDQAILVTPTGMSVQVGNSDMFVGPDGELLQRTPGSDDARRLDDAEQMLKTEVAVQDIDALDTEDVGTYRRLASRSVLTARDEVAGGPYSKCKRFLDSKAAGDGICLAFKYSKVAKVLAKMSKTGVHTIKVKNLPMNDQFPFSSMILNVDTLRHEGLPAAAGHGDREDQPISFALRCPTKGKDCFAVAWPKFLSGRGRRLDRSLQVLDGESALGLAFAYSICGKVEGMCDFLGFFTQSLNAVAFAGEQPDGSWRCQSSDDCPRMIPHCDQSFTCVGSAAEDFPACGVEQWEIPAEGVGMYCENFRDGSDDLGSHICADAVSAGLSHLCVESVAECLELAEQEEGCGDYVHTDGGNTCKCMRRGVTCVPAVATSADIYVKRPCCEEDSDCPSAESCTRGTCSSCKDTASLYAVDTYGTGCDFYASTPEHCSANDDHDFTSAKMCCSCGGGCGPTGAGSCCTADSECSGDTPKCHSAGFCGCAADSDCAADAEHPLCVDGSCSGCRDTSEGATSGRYTCKQLVAWGFCGDSQFDDDDFSLASMCCGCGGGYRGEA